MMSEENNCNEQSPATPSTEENKRDKMLRLISVLKEAKNIRENLSLMDEIRDYMRLERERMNKLFDEIC
jgi:hypothetical protein